jgi:hypothetical protein
MMKKLVLLTMVLGMASMAMAVPYFQVDPSYHKSDYNPGNVIQIDLVDPVSDAPVTGVAIDAITDNPGGAPEGTSYAPLTANANFNTITSMGTLNQDGMVVEGVYLDDTTIPARGATGILYSFMYKVPSVPASTIINIQNYVDNVSWYSDIDYNGASSYLGSISMLQGGYIHVVPEPATLALLGLGGLLLRRFK